MACREHHEKTCDHFRMVGNCNGCGAYYHGLADSYIPDIKLTIDGYPCRVDGIAIESSTNSPTKYTITAVQNPHATPQKKPLEITNVIFNNPATIVFWSDGTKTVVQARADEEYDPEKGMAMAISKKMLGGKRDYYHTFLHWLKKYDKEEQEYLEDLEGLVNFTREKHDVSSDIEHFDNVVRSVFKRIFK